MPNWEQRPSGLLVPTAKEAAPVPEPVTTCPQCGSANVDTGTIVLPGGKRAVNKCWACQWDKRSAKSPDEPGA